MRDFSIQFDVAAPPARVWEVMSDGERWADWTPSDLKPFVHRTIDIFGTERVMYGSDWPVSLLAGSYGAVKAALEEALPPLSPEELTNVFGGNAIRFYRLDVS